MKFCRGQRESKTAQSAIKKMAMAAIQVSREMREVGGSALPSVMQSIAIYNCSALARSAAIHTHVCTHTESWNTMVWKGAFKAIYSAPAAMRRDIFSCIRLLREPSKLTWDASWHGSSTASLDNSFQSNLPLVWPVFLSLMSSGAVCQS